MSSHKCCEHRCVDPCAHFQGSVCPPRRRLCSLESPCARHVRIAGYDEEEGMWWVFLQKAGMMLAEFFGTWLYVLFGITATALDPVGVFAAAFIFGLAYAALGAATGGIGSGHFNPYITLAFLALGYIPGGYSLGGILTAAGFIGFQVLGGLVAAWTLDGIIGRSGVPVLGVTVPTGFVAGNFWLVVLAEFIGTAGLIFVVLQVLRPKAHHTPQIGWWLAVGLYIVAALDFLGLVGTGGSLNFARSFGPAVVSGHWGKFGAYVLGGLFGTAAGVAVHVVLRILNDMHCWYAMMEDAFYGMNRSMKTKTFGAATPHDESMYPAGHAPAAGAAAAQSPLLTNAKANGGLSRTAVVIKSNGSMVKTQ